MKAEWFTFLQSGAIITSFLFAAWAALREIRSRRLSNYLQLTAYHRDLWQLTFEHPTILDVFSHETNLQVKELDPFQRRFLNFLFLHISCSFELQLSNSLIRIEQLEYDVADVMSYPTIKNFWEENKRFYNNNYIMFVENA